MGRDVALSARMGTAIPDARLRSAGPSPIETGLMLSAMMLPLLKSPILHVRTRSFRRTRSAATALFIAGYFAIWTSAITILSALTATVFGSASNLEFPAALAVAALWQCSPAKQRFLARCHRRPPLAAIGPRAASGALLYGASHGLWCVGSCWALMLVSIAGGGWSLALMAATGGWMLAEQFDRPEAPRWRLRWPARAARILVQWLVRRTAVPRPGQFD